MALLTSNFIPEIWSAALLSALRNQLVFAQEGLTNRDYEGEVAAAGDTVHITSITDVAVQAYTGTVDYDDLADTQKTLTIQQKDFFAFNVDDIQRRQSLPGFVEEASRSAAYGLSNKVDTYVSGLMKAGVDSANKIGAADTQLDPSTDGAAYKMLVDLRTKLVKSNVPNAGRWAVVPPEVYAYLLQDDRFIRADASGTTEGLRNGLVGRAAGFDIYESNTVPHTTDATNGDYWTVLAGHSMATTFVQQILNTESIRREGTFGDGVRGLHVYDAMVIRPTCLASIVVADD